MVGLPRLRLALLDVPQSTRAEMARNSRGFLVQTTKSQGGVSVEVWKHGGKGTRKQYFQGVTELLQGIGIGFAYTHGGGLTFPQYLKTWQPRQVFIETCASSTLLERFALGLHMKQLEHVSSRRGVSGTATMGLRMHKTGLPGSIGPLAKRPLPQDPAGPE